MCCFVLSSDMLGCGVANDRQLTRIRARPAGTTDVDCSLCQLRQRLEQLGSGQDMREKWTVAIFTTAISSVDSCRTARASATAQYTHYH